MIYTDELLAIEDTIDLLCHNIIESDVVKNYVVTKVALLKNAETQDKRLPPLSKRNVLLNEWSRMGITHQIIQKNDEL